MPTENENGFRHKQVPIISHHRTEPPSWLSDASSTQLGRQKDMSSREEPAIFGGSETCPKLLGLGCDHCRAVAALGPRLICVPQTPAPLVN